MGTPILGQQTTKTLPNWNKAICLWYCLGDSPPTNCWGSIIMNHKKGNSWGLYSFIGDLPIIIHPFWGAPRGSMSRRIISNPPGFHTMIVRVVIVTASRAESSRVSEDSPQNLHFRSQPRSWNQGVWRIYVWYVSISFSIIYLYLVSFYGTCGYINMPCMDWVHEYCLAWRQLIWNSGYCIWMKGITTSRAQWASRHPQHSKYVHLYRVKGLFRQVNNLYTKW